jgi:hypothetical protein
MLKKYCPRARSDMAQCYFKEGDIAVGRNAAGEELCIGCGWLLSSIPKTINAAEVGYDIDWYLEKGGQMLDLKLEPVAIPETADEAVRARMYRWNKLATTTGELFEGDPDEKVTPERMEEKLQALWRRTAKS